MDTSKEYIEMCKKAEEIQELWNPSIGDWYFGRGHYYEIIPHFKNEFEVFILCDYDSEGGHFHLEPNHIDKSIEIWLPRQDQLQEMVGGTSLWKIVSIHRHCHLIDTHVPSASSSMEQLWLAFVMKEKYDKTWDGKDWIPRGEEK